MNIQTWNGRLEKAATDFATAAWPTMPAGHLTFTVRLLQDLQELARVDRLCSADLQRVIVTLVDVGYKSVMERLAKP